MTTGEPVVVEVDLGDDVVHAVALAAPDPDRYHYLVAAHLPREDVDEPWDGDSFPPALIAACCTWLEVRNGDDVVEHIDTPPAAVVAAVVDDDWPVDAAAEVFEQALILANPEGFDWARIRLRGSPRFELEAAVAAHYRIPHSQFMAWEPRDRQIALAYHVESRDRCPGCGVPSRLMQDVEGADLHQAECGWCEERDRVLADIPEQRRTSVHVHVAPVRGR